MQTPLISLIAASVAFVGLHFALSHPWRAALVKALQLAKAQDARYLPGWCGVEPG